MKVKPPAPNDTQHAKEIALSILLVTSRVLHSMVWQDTLTSLLPGEVLYCQALTVLQH